jgi:uncharacterized membrane protein
MSDTALTANPQPWWRRYLGPVVALAGTAVILALAFGPDGANEIARLAARGRPHAPNLAAIASASLPVKVHLATLALSFVTGAVLLSGVKGTPLHRTLGWAWAALMGTTAVASLFIRSSSGFSVLHLFAAWKLLALPLGVWAARRHKVARHRATMTGLFFGGLIVAGLVAFTPGRLMWRVFFG